MVIVIYTLYLMCSFKKETLKIRRGTKKWN